MRAFYTGWRTVSREIDFDKLSQEGRVDYVLLDNHLRYQLALLDRQDKNRAETVALLPFADRLLTLQDTRRNLAPVDARAAAKVVADSREAGRQPPRAVRGPGRSRRCWQRRRCCRRRATGRHGAPAPSGPARLEDRGQSWCRQRRSDAWHRRQLVSLLRRLRSDVLLVAQGSVSRSSMNRCTAYARTLRERVVGSARRGRSDPGCRCRRGWCRRRWTRWWRRRRRPGQRRGPDHRRSDRRRRTQGRSRPRDDPVHARKNSSRSPSASTRSA